MSNKQNSIEITTLCRHYRVERAFFSQLNEIGLIETTSIENNQYVDETDISHIDRIIRLYQELEINPEGIDVIINLLNKIEQLEVRLNATQNRLKLYE